MATERVCSIPKCGKPYLAKGYCCKHYKKWRRYGDPMGGIAATPGDPIRFIHEVALPSSQDECIIWPYGRHNSAGYGSLSVNGKVGYVHRYVCEKAHGPAPENRKLVAHNCGNTTCCNPRHLRWATPTENASDRNQHGTDIKGEKHPLRKLSDGDVLKIRSLAATCSQSKIAKMFGIGQATVSFIVNRKLWKHIP